MSKLTKLEQNKAALKEIQETIGMIESHDLAALKMEEAFLISEIAAEESMVALKRYKDILGKQVTYTTNGMVYKGFVAGADPKIGITVKPLDEGVNSEYLWCCRMGIALHDHGPEVSERLFYALVEYIRKHDQLYNTEIVRITSEVIGARASMGGGNCPFTE